MAPDNCDDWQPDDLTQRDAKRKRLVQYLEGVWRLLETDRIDRYDNVTIGNTIFNGWAIWEKK